MKFFDFKFFDFENQFKYRLENYVFKISKKNKCKKRR